MQDVTITPVVIGTAAGSFVSILFFILQIFSIRVDQLPANVKQGYNMLGVVVVTAAIALLSCFSQIVFVECTQLGLYDLIMMGLMSLVGNVATYKSLDRVVDATKARVR